MECGVRPIRLRPIGLAGFARAAQSHNDYNLLLRALILVGLKLRQVLFGQILVLPFWGVLHILLDLGAGAGHVSLFSVNLSKQEKKIRLAMSAVD